mmetsp:Transcript_48208/g.119387  ORF Transcript_48208/g.119387 Transcript_48208/m.119387 type:complete len:81 (+) Transcript_48208:276-518(+)
MIIAGKKHFMYRISHAAIATGCERLAKSLRPAEASTNAPALSNTTVIIDRYHSLTVQRRPIDGRPNQREHLMNNSVKRWP